LKAKTAADLSVKQQQGDMLPQFAVSRSPGLTEWKQIDEVLREKAELFDLAHDSIMVRDLENRILFWNTGAEARYGWRKEEAVGQLSHTLLQTQYPMSIEDINQDFFIKSWWEGELVHTTREGDPIIVASRWTPLRDEYGQIRATLEINSDITASRRMEKEIEDKSNRLQEVNAALKTLLRQRDEDRKELEDAIATNIENLILPYLKRLKISPLSSTQTALVEVLESHLRELTSKFLRSIVLDYRILTPTEMRVAVLVREGKTTKEIADMLCISEKTASFHRDNIRIKFGLRGKRINLRSHLLSLP
jgi:PAS domain S-box-containing protein